MIRARYAPSSVRDRIVVDIRTDHDADSELWWETTVGEPPQLPDRLDPVALALVCKAMNFTQDLHLEGPVSWRLLANLEEYIDVWTMWRPDIYRRIAITADEVIDDRGDGPGRLGTSAVAAFSGGVDGTYAAFASAHGLLGRRSVDIAAAVLVHGFDIPLDDERGFALAVESGQAIAEECETSLIAVRTNWQAVADPEWQMTFSTAIAAVLHLFTDRAGVAIQAADNTYREITIPWGSNPISGPLLSSSRMRMVQPGGGLTRTQKVRAIGGLPSVRAHLRVCWEGDQLGRNCQRCEKCVRTKVNFLAAGHGVAPALGALVPGEIRGLTIGSTGAQAVYLEMLEDMDLLPPDVAEDLRWLIDQPLVLHETGPHPDEPPAPAAEPPAASHPRRVRPFRRGRG